ncbi:hypothetical protein BT67DRAFT_153568 [Trichocladium antarcticum]|uniref:Uncharacterized protein n=1 Tax=Trichocladium antarcticum TaxID=1450529 RepID=A0AAN6UF72_9PEZI|nr:hypothetical protein BT67DRAFT_153568 [Trichocladium antarcticum]
MSQIPAQLLQATSETRLLVSSNLTPPAPRNPASLRRHIARPPHHPAAARLFRTRCRPGAIFIAQTLLAAASVVSGLAFTAVGSRLGRGFPRRSL